MPRMDGFTFLRWLMRAKPVPVIVVSSRADDRSVLDRLLALPGIRPLLSENLQAGGGSMRLKNGVLRVRRSTRILASFRLGPNPDQVCAIAREEWALLAAASALA